MEVAERVLSAIRQRASVAVMGIKAVIDVAVEAVRTMEPGASSDEYATAEPLGPVVPVRSAVVWRVVVVAIRARGFGANVDRDLRG